MEPETNGIPMLASTRPIEGVLPHSSLNRSANSDSVARPLEGPHCLDDYLRSNSPVSTTSRTELEQLLAPIAGPDPAGDSRAYAHRLREQLQELRREDDPSAYSDATRPSTWKHADWEGVLELADKALQEESKDLRVACHRAEALVRLEGLTGLHESLHLLGQLAELSWERLNPPLEEDDLDSRAAPLANMLDDPDRGLCFPNLVRELPLIGPGEQALSFAQWNRLRGSGDPESVALCEEVIHASTPAELDANFQTAAACLEELQSLRQVLDDKLGDHAPGFVHLEEALHDCHRLVGLALQEVGGPPASEEEPSDSASESSETEPSRPAELEMGNARSAVDSRRAAYRQIEQAANFLCQIEPHSPVPYLVKRAVGLSKLPFPQLIRQLVREENILNEMYRELGIDTSGGDSSDVSSASD